MLTTPLLFIIPLIIAASFAATPAAQAQTTIPTGSIFIDDPVSCPSNFYSGMTCLGATIDCTNVNSNIDDINVTVGYVTQAATPTGTIVFFTGGTGTASDFGPPTRSQTTMLGVK